MYTNMQPNLKAFLEMIGRAEGTVTSPATKNEGYDVIVTGIDGHPEVFSDYSMHPFVSRPAKIVNSANLLSTAAGRYQILLRYWIHYQQTLSLPDFGPDSQDQYVLQQLRERNALGMVVVGKFNEALFAISGLWASLPGKKYEGQHQRTVDYVRTAYVAAGGYIA